MSYTSFKFIAFVAVTAAVYFLFPIKKYQWTVLLAASYVFYLVAGYKYAAFIVFTTISVYYLALTIDKIAQRASEELKAHKQDWDREQKKEYKARIDRKKRRIMALAVVINIGILAFLKYSNFFVGSLSSLTGLFGLEWSAPTLKLFLPLGISFYTFQSVGYVVDVYRGKFPAERNLAKLALFVSFFPQIIQGPISFYDKLAYQLYEPHSVDFTRMKHGAELVLWGFFKKLVIADRALIAINCVSGNYTAYSGTAVGFAILLYALQLYTDFSGGIDVSRGVAQILGIDMVQNFKRPYFSISINDYWRRWHITLGAWMKEYVFYPLALSKRFTNVSKKIRATSFGASRAGAHVAKVLPTSFASLIVFLLVGIWHGADWRYVAFGLWNGGIIMLSTLLEPLFELANVKLRINVKALWFHCFRILRTFLIVLVGYVFDVAWSLKDALVMFYMMLTKQSLSMFRHEFLELGLNKLDYALLAICTVFLFGVSLVQERHSDSSIRAMLDEKPFILRYMFLLVGIVTILIFGMYVSGLGGTEFVYMQF